MHVSHVNGSALDWLLQCSLPTGCATERCPPSRHKTGTQRHKTLVFGSILVATEKLDVTVQWTHKSVSGALKPQVTSETLQ